MAADAAAPAAGIAPTPATRTPAATAARRSREDRLVLVAILYFPIPEADPLNLLAVTHRQER
ncbi:hypothetical protein GCM10009738_41730 [Kitasatospora viridis]